MNSTTLAASISTITTGLFNASSSDALSGEYVGIGMFCIFAVGVLSIGACKMIKKYGAALCQTRGVPEQQQQPLDPDAELAVYPNEIMDAVVVGFART